MDPKDEIRQRVDIVDLITEYLPLKQAGSVSFKGLCPFHTEKTPSFHVSRDKQIWHCFGCSEGGDCFAFVMRMEGMDFPEALRHLGAKAGVEVKRFDSTESNEKQRLLTVNELAAKFYRKVLTDSSGAAEARAYVEKRGIPPELAETFGLGFAPETWDLLSSFLKKRGYSDQDGERAGVLLRRKQGSGTIDRFRNRLMIPLRDHHGNTVGFTGRIFRSAGGEGSQGVHEEDGPKYMNSPETAIYHKGRLLYGLDLAKRAIKDRGNVIVVEGNLDVIASHKAGVQNVVASSGTALTEEQLLLLKRYTTTLIFSFDGDAAGFKAARRGIAIAQKLGLDVQVAVLPPEAGKDPDEAVQKNPELWRSAVRKTVPIMQYFIERAIAGRDLGQVEDKRAVSSFLLPEIARMKDVVEREHWLQVVADLVRTDLGELRTAMKASTEPQSPVHAPAFSERKFVDPPTPASARGGGFRAKPAKDEQMARLLLGMCIHDPLVRTECLSALKQADLFPEPLRVLYKALQDAYTHEQSPPQADNALFARLREQLAAHPSHDTLIPLCDVLSLEAEQFVAGLEANEVKTHARQLMTVLKESDVRRRRKALEADIRRAELAHDTEAVEQFIRAYNALV